MPRDPREFIFITASMPHHYKIEGLSDKAFRLLIETWCYCREARNDGHITGRLWSKRGASRARHELVEAGLFEDDLTGGVIVHDWEDFQQTVAEIEKAVDEGIWLAHVRHHEKTGKTSPACKYCTTSLNGHAPAVRSAMRT